MRKRTFRERLTNTRLGHLFKSGVSAFELALLAHYKRESAPEFIRLFREVRKEEGGPVLFSPHEVFVIYSLARGQRRHGGAFVEVGMFRGLSAKVICSAKTPETKFFGFDTFEGLPHAGDDDPLFEKGMFRADEAGVLRRLKGFPNVTVTKGVFPATAGVLKGQKVSFAHLDVDTYESTLACLRGLDPLMLSGGIILSHDYSQAAGVRRAFGEFLDGRSDYRLFELPISQVIIIRS